MCVSNPQVVHNFIYQLHLNKAEKYLDSLFKNKNIWVSIYILGHPEQPQYDCHISILESQTQRGGEAHLPHHVQLTNQSRPPSQSHINRNAGVWLLAATYVNKASDSVTYVVDIKDSSVYIIWFVKILLFTFPSLFSDSSFPVQMRRKLLFSVSERTVSPYLLFF